MTKWGLLTLVLLCLTGCGKDTDDSLETLSLKRNRTEEKCTEEMQSQTEVKETDELEVSEEPKRREAESIFVYVCGAVQLPGVYELKAGARIYEAVALAGGVREDAAKEVVNQAQVLNDGEQIYIPTEEEAMAKDIRLFSEEAQSVDGTKNGKVNINMASEEELMTLSGIGNTRAKSIVEYRENNGGFQTIEDLMKVDGIKEGVFEKIKDSITVNAGS